MFNNKKKLEAAQKAAWSDGFTVGTKKAVAEARKVFVKRIRDEMNDVARMVDTEYLDGLERAIELIRKGK